MKTFENIKNDEANYMQVYLKSIDIRSQYRNLDETEKTVSVIYNKRLENLNEYTTYFVAYIVMRLVLCVKELTVDENITLADYEQVLSHENDLLHENYDFSYFRDELKWSGIKREFFRYLRILDFSPDEFELLFTNVKLGIEFSYNELRDNLANYVNDNLGTKIPTSKELNAIKLSDLIYIPQSYYELGKKCGMNSYDPQRAIKGYLIDIVTAYNNLQQQYENQDEILINLIELIYRTGITINDYMQFKSGLLMDNKAYIAAKKQVSKLTTSI